MKKLIVSLGLALGLLAMASSTALAVEIIKPDKGEGNVTVSSNETHKNLYVGGASVLVNGSTTGDLIVAGGNITVEGPVEQDVAAAGGNIHINGSVGGDIRSFGGTVVVNGQVNGDVVVLGGTIQISDRATIGGDLIVNGGDVTIDGPVKGKLTVNGGKVTVNSAVGGEAKIRAGELTFGSKADVPSNISYQGPKEAMVNDGAKVGNIDYTKVSNNRGGRNLAGVFAVASLIKLLAAIAFALLLLYLLPRTSRKALNQFANRPWLNLLIGFIGLIFIPIAAIIVMVILLGLYVGLLAIFLYILLIFISAFVAMTYTGSWIIQKLSKHDTIKFDWQGVVVGAIVIAVLKFIPVVGWLAVIVLMLIAFGGLLRGLYHFQQNDQAI